MWLSSVLSRFHVTGTGNEAHKAFKAGGSPDVESQGSGVYDGRVLVNRKRDGHCAASDLCSASGWDDQALDCGLQSLDGSLDTSGELEEGILAMTDGVAAFYANPLYGPKQTAMMLPPPLNVANANRLLQASTATAAGPQYRGSTTSRQHGRTSDFTGDRLPAIPAIRENNSGTPKKCYSQPSSPRADSAHWSGWQPIGKLSLNDRPTSPTSPASTSTTLADDNSAPLMAVAVVPPTSGSSAAAAGVPPTSGASAAAAGASPRASWAGCGTAGPAAAGVVASPRASWPGCAMAEAGLIVAEPLRPAAAVPRVPPLDLTQLPATLAKSSEGSLPELTPPASFSDTPYSYRKPQPLPPPQSPAVQTARPAVQAPVRPATPAVASPTPPTKQQPGVPSVVLPVAAPRVQNVWNSTSSSPQQNFLNSGASFQPSPRLNHLSVAATFQPATAVAQPPAPLPMAPPPPPLTFRRPEPPPLPPKRPSLGGACAPIGGGLSVAPVVVVAQQWGTPIVRLGTSPCHDSGGGWLSQLAEDGGDDEGAWLSGVVTIRFEELQLGQQIGEGGFGKVYLGSWRGLPVAVKLANLQANDQPHLIAEFHREVHTMSCLPRHPNVLRLVGACTQAPNLALVTEYCARGSLFAKLHTMKQPLTLTQMLSLSLDIARGMAHLHAARVLHRDLKSANLLLDDSGDFGSVKICDFGLSRILRERTPMTGGLGTYQWMAPEVLTHQRYSEKADVYSFAVVMYELLTRRVPYAGMTAVQAAIGVVNSGLRPELPPGKPTSFTTLMMQCWAAVPDQRPRFDQIIDVLCTLMTQAGCSPCPSNASTPSHSGSWAQR